MSPVALSPFRIATGFRWSQASKQRYWRVDYSYREGAYPSSDFYKVGAQREYDPTDPWTNFPLPYNADWDVSFRRDAIASQSMWPAGEREKVTTRREFVAQRYTRLSGVAYAAADGPYEWKDWTWIATKAAFAGFLVQSYTTDTTMSDDELPRLEPDFAYWWDQMLKKGATNGWTEMQRGGHYETDSLFNRL